MSPHPAWPRIRSFIGGPGHWRRRWRIRFVLLFLLACLLTLGLEALAEHAIDSASKTQPGFAPSVFELSGVYQTIVASGPAKPGPRFAAVVVLEPSRDPSLLNICKQRAFLAALLGAVAKLSPTLIVIDKYFGATSCPLEGSSTIALQTTIREVGRSIPIVVGRRVDVGKRTGTHGPEGWPRLLPALPLAQDAKIHEGIVNVDQDTRRLPLGWTVQTDDGRVVWRRTLALEAAQIHDPTLLDKSPRLARLIRDHQHPYIGFLSLHALETYATFTTDDIFCARPEERHRVKAGCPATAPRDTGYLSGRIALIGEYNMDLDSHFSVVGEVPGYILQANYVEALLDGRYFRAVDGWVNYVAGFLIYLAFHWVLITHHHALQVSAGWRVPLVLLQALGWSIAVIVVTIGLLYLIVVHAGWYVNPSAIGMLALVIKFSELIFAKVPSAEGDHR